MAALLGFFAALPDILKLVQQFMAWLNQVSGNDPQGFVKAVSAAFAEVNVAQTQQERQNAAKALADLISRLP